MVPATQRRGEFLLAVCINPILTGASASPYCSRSNREQGLEHRFGCTRARKGRAAAGAQPSHKKEILTERLVGLNYNAILSSKALVHVKRSVLSSPRTSLFVLHPGIGPRISSAKRLPIRSPIRAA